MTDWQIHPRDADLGRTYDPLSGWTSLTLVERYGPPDSWTVTGPSSALDIFTPGMGCILDSDGAQVASGKLTSIQRGATYNGTRLVDTMLLGFTGDKAALGGRLVFPTRTHGLTPSISTFPDAYDLRSGPVETLIVDYTSASLGTLALTDRRLARLRLPTSLGRGGTTQVSGRLDNLGILIQSLEEAGNLRVALRHVEDAGGAWLDLVINEVADLSENVRFGTADSMAAGLISEWSYELSAPTTTRAIVAGGGDLAAREFLQLTDPAAEALWGSVVETMVDQRSVAPDSDDKLGELTRAGQESLDSGKGPVKVSFTPILGPDLVYRRDVRVGDVVGYDLPGLEPAEDKIREATTVVKVESGQPTESVSVVVGSPDAPQTRSQQQTVRALRSVNVIQRSK